MLAYLRGTVMAKAGNGVVVAVGDVGYRVFVVAPLRDQLQVGDAVALWTYEVVRDERRELFGFPTADTLALFEQLITVSGVGPKSALGILALGDPQEIRDAIAREDAVYLSKVVGVGRKTAERVIVELKGKMQELAPSVLPGVSHTTDGDILVALEQLGYKAREVRDVLRSLPPSGTSEEKLKAALQALGRG
ncbi:MAG: Holliday junction branch migration protein RuvA [bacterium]|nr:Holliday junction branch migration protein RuvA [bacterium]